MVLVESPELCNRAPPETPAPQRDESPDRLDQPERPGALQKPIDRTQRAGHGKSQDEPMAALLQRVSHQHRGHREQAEKAKGVHCAIPLLGPSSKVPNSSFLIPCLSVWRKFAVTILTRCEIVQRCL